MNRIERRARQIVAEGLPIGPRMYPCVCGAGRASHGGAHGTGAHKPTGCTRYRSDRAWELAYKALDAQATRLGHAIRDADDLERRAHYKANPRADGEWSIGASDTSTCPKKIEYRNKPPEDMIWVPEDKREARMGTIIHAEVTRKMRVLYPWREFAGRVTIPGLDRQSEFDSYDPITCEVEDYKTAGDWRWDVLGDNGPEESVWEQVMLYAYALIAAGREVHTVKVSYIKRCNGHDEVFVRDYDEQVAKAALDRLLGYATSLDLGIELPKTGTGPSNDALCRRCLAAETEVVTDRGIRRIGDIVGERVHILDGNGGWLEAEAKAFGVQPLMRLTLSRRGIEKVVHATPDHGWFVVDKRTRMRLETRDLEVGDWLTSVRAKSTPRKGRHPIIPAPVGIQHGFVYGDGTRAARRNGGSSASFHGHKDAAMLRWFPHHRIGEKADGSRWVANLPRFFKSAPPMDESSSYLYGFLAGYFAADGCVDERGRCTMASASRESIDLIRDIAFRLGIGVGAARGQWRIGRSGARQTAEETYLHTVTLNARTLTADFFLIDAHRERWQAAGMAENEAPEAQRWQVVDVLMTDRVEETYCFEVPTTHSFVLADNLLTSNCFARAHCWNIPVAEALGRSPESVTILGAEPADESIAWAVQEKVEAAATRLAAKKREDETKSLLDGLPPGRYGDYEGYEKGGGGGEDMAAYADTLAGLFDLPDDQRPPVMAVPIPKKHRYTFIQWGKVRKATLEREKRERAELEKE